MQREVYNNPKSFQGAIQWYLNGATKALTGNTNLYFL